MPACEFECVGECDFRLKVVCCWGLFWPGMVGGRKRASAPLLSIILVFPLKYPRVLKLIRGCIGSSGNVRVGRLAIGLSSWNMGKFVFPGEWRLYIKSLQLSMWSSFKASCLGYPNHIHTYIYTIQFSSKLKTNLMKTQRGALLNTQIMRSKTKKWKVFRK